jgi:hypothetical protein
MHARVNKEAAPRVSVLRTMNADMLRLAILLLFAAPGFTAEPVAARPVLLEGLLSRAEVTGPRGTFVTELISLADGTTRFVQVYPPADQKKRGRVEIVVAAGREAYQRDGKGQFVTAPPGMSSFVLGHDALRHALANESRLAKISQPAPAEMGGGTVTIELADYRKVIGFDLPFMATFIHSAAPDDRYVYRYTELLPFRVAPGSPSPGDGTNPAALFERLGDLAEIAGAHEHVMAAHRASDAAMLTADAAERSTISGRGRLSEVTGDEQRARMRRYLGAIRFSRYEDTAVPVIALAQDGTLAWLACQMEAEGIHTVEGRSESIAYGFSWTEFYARGPIDRRGRRAWRAIGNASSERP